MNRLCQTFCLALVTAIFSFAKPEVANAHHDSHRYAHKRLEIYLDDWQLRGTSTIYLKKELRRRYPQFDLHSYSLRKVLLLAKSRRGHGLASLSVGDYYTREQTIQGQPRDFRHNGYFYNRLKFRNPAPGADGPWQIHLRGNINVNRVVLELSARYGNRRPIENYSQHNQMPYLPHQRGYTVRRHREQVADSSVFSLYGKPRQ